MIKRLKKFLMEPTGIRLEWMTGGFRFSPPMWGWLLLFFALYIWLGLKIYFKHH